MSCPQAMDLVAQIEGEMSLGAVLKRRLAREALFVAMPQIGIFDIPGYEQEANQAATQATVAMIRPRAQYLSAGNPEEVSSTTKTLRVKQQHLFESEPQGFGNATQDLQNWQGSAADGFRRYLNRLESDYRVAQDALNDLATLYGLYQDIVSQTHADLISVLQAGLSAYQNVESQALPVVLTTASEALAPLTAGSSLVLVTMAAIVSYGSALAQTIQISSSSDLSTAQSIVVGLDALKGNTNARVQQLNSTLAELGEKINATSTDVWNNLPQFAEPGQGFDPGSFEPDSEPSGLQPISARPLVPGIGSISRIINV